MDPLHVGIALGPLATYLLVLGTINLSSRPVVASGVRDAAALALGIIGLVAAGPMELFLVEEAVVLYGGWVWGIMLDQLRPVVADVVSRLDRDARWAGESLVMPQLGVQLHMEYAHVMKNVQLVSAGPQQNLHGWRQLELELRTALRRTRTMPNAHGGILLGCGVMLAAVITYLLARDPAGVMQSLNEMLRR
jgi:hypothetical protein